MGIAYYFSWIIQNHKNIIEKFNSNYPVDYLYIDSNSIIYDSIDFSVFKNTAQFELYIINSVIKKIEIIINKVNPGCTYIAFDGVPPIAKLTQQKNRRYKSWFQSHILKNNVLWDTCSITPGTQFMNNLNNAIKEYYKSRSHNILLSLSDEPGEGEHKIFDYIRKNNHTNKNIIVYGMDADLIMLSLNHLKLCKSIYLYRETPHFINSLDKSLNPNETYLINISLLGIQIFKLLTSNNSQNMNNTNEPQWLTDATEILITDISNSTLANDTSIYYSKIEDYIFICFLLGNDFMPHLPSINIRINGLTILLDLYRSLFGINKHLIKDGRIIWSNFKLFIKKLAENEEMFIKENYNLREKRNKKIYPTSNDKEKELKFVEIPSWERNVEKFINPHEKFWEFRYYYSLFGINTDNVSNNNIDTIPHICYNYLETLQWTYYYYSGDCINWSHCYKYHYPPLLIDLYKHIPHFDSEIIIKNNKDVIHPYLLLSYVLPKNSLNLLPSKIHNYLLKNYEIHYREDYKFLYAFCKYFWEGHVKFPNLEIEEFSKEIIKLI
jgi:5'-3' exonuclease